jgi:hypothetical protein
LKDSSTSLENKTALSEPKNSILPGVSAWRSKLVEFLEASEPVTGDEEIFWAHKALQNRLMAAKAKMGLTNFMLEIHPSGYVRPDFRGD